MLGSMPLTAVLPAVPTPASPRASGSATAGGGGGAGSSFLLEHAASVASPISNGRRIEPML
jgi:hypothetical protein